MSALGKLVVSLALNHAEYTQGLNRSDQAALKFAQNSQRQFDRAERAAKRAFKGVVLGAAGMVASFVSVNASLSKVKGIIDFQDELGKMSQKTGIAVESLAGLDFAASQSGTKLDVVAKGVRGFSRIIADSSGAPNKFTEILAAMGVEIDVLKGKSPEEQFFALADAVQGLGEQDRAVAITSLLGDRMAELAPLLSGGSERLRDLVTEGQKYNPVTAESAARAELFNDNLDRLGRSANMLAVNVGTNAVPSLNRITVAMIQAHEESGFLAAGFAAIGQSAKELFKGVFGSSDSADFASSDIGRLLNGKTTVDELKGAIGQLGNEGEDAAGQLDPLAKLLARIDEQSSKAGKSGDQLTKSLTAEEREVEALERDIKRLTAAYDPLIARNEQLARLMKLLEHDPSIPREIIDSESIRIINEAEDAINGVENAVDDVAIAEEDLRITSRSVFGDVDQFATQAARNIHSSFANMILEMKFDLGSFANIAKRMFAEIASARILQRTGLAGVLGLGSGAAAASTGGGVGAFDIANLASGASNLYTSFSGGIGGSLGSLAASAGETFGISALTSFGAGASGAASAGVFGAGGLPFLGGGIGSAGTAAGVVGTGTAAGLGASVAAIAGPLAIAAVADIGLRQIFGDKKLGGAAGDVLSYVPVVGTLINGLFGRGQYKFRRQELSGQISESGFEDASLVDVLRSKGGLFAKNKFKERAAGNEADILDLFDESAKAFFTSTRSVADNLGLSAKALNDLTISVDLESQKKKQFTEEEFSAELSRISDTIATGLIPNIDELAKRGETASAALSRFNTEFNVLTGLGNALNYSTADSQQFLRDIGTAERSALIDSLGGSESVGQFSAFFSESFRTNAENLAIATDDLSTALLDAGFAADLTKDQYKALVESFTKDGGINASQLKELISIGPRLASIRDAAANDAFGALSSSVAREQQEIAKQVGLVTGRMNELSGVLNLTGNAINTIFPIGKFQARSLVSQAANDGDFDNPDLGRAMSALTKSSTAGFATRVDFLRDQAASANSLRELEAAAGSQLSIEEQTLATLEDDSVRLDGILSNADLQLKELQGIKEALSVTDAKAQFDSVIAGGGGSGRSLSDQSLSDFANKENVSSLDLYNFAKNSGGTIEQGIRVLGLDRSNVDNFLRDNDLPRFADGGFHSGGLRLVGERGPELEFTQPSRIFSNSDSKKMLDNSEVVDLLKQVLTAIKDGNVDTKHAAKILDNVAGEGVMLTEVA